MNEFRFNCPKCGQNILAAAKWSGRRMSCPSCDTRLIIPAAAAASRKGNRRPLGIEVTPEIKIRVKLGTQTEAKASPPSSASKKVRSEPPRRS